MGDPRERTRAVIEQWLSMGRWDKVEPEARSLLAADPFDCGAMWALAFVLMRKGDHSAAEQVIARMLELEPDHPRGWLLAAEARYLTRQDDAAEQAARTAIELAPSDPAGYSMLASILLAKENLMAADAFAREALKLQPDHMDALRVVAWVALHTRRPDLAEQAIRTLLELAPTDGFAMSTAGVILRALGQRSQGMRLLRDLIVKEPNEPRWHILMAETLWDRGEILAARRSYREALRLDPSLDDVRKILRMGRRSRGDDLPEGWGMYHVITTWDEDGRRIETIDWDGTADVQPWETIHWDDGSDWE